MDKQLLTDKKLFPALTGIRAVAAFMVFFCHLRFHLYSTMLQYIQFSLGGGVTLFFVLSGFLITYRYYPTFQLTYPWFKTYVINRFARIYPVYFLLVTIVIVWKGYFGINYLIENYTLTHTLVNPSHAAIAPSWSLTVEECFYISAPFIMLLMKRFNAWLPLLIYIPLVVIVLLLRNNEPNIILANHYLFMMTFFGRFFEFFIGSFVAVRMLKGRYSMQRNGSRYTTTGIIGILVLLSGIAYTYTIPGLFRTAVTQITFDFLLPFPALMLIYGLCSETTGVSKLLSGKAFDLFGKSSYSFYLVHMPLIELTLPLIRTLHGIKYNLFVVGMFAVTLALSILIYIYYESPMHKYIKRTFLKPAKVISI